MRSSAPRPDWTDGGGFLFSTELNTDEHKAAHGEPTDYALIVSLWIPFDEVITTFE